MERQPERGSQKTEEKPRAVGSQVMMTESWYTHPSSFFPQYGEARRLDRGQVVKNSSVRSASGLAGLRIIRKIAAESILQYSGNRLAGLLAYT